MTGYSVIPNRFYRHKPTGRVASFWGAAPWWGPQPEEWETVTDGYTTSNPDGTVGMSCITDRSLGAVSALVARLNAERSAALEKHRREWAPVNAPIEWRKAVGNDGVTRHHSGEGYSIAKLGDWYQVEHGDEPDLPAYRSLAKAKEWCARCIRSERKDRAFA